MKFIGPHVSASGGVQNAPVNARALDASGFGLFVKNQRQWSAPAYTNETIASFKKQLAESGYAPEQVLAHAGYLINLGNSDPDAYKKSLDAFIDELKRCAALGLTLLNIHPGSHLRLCTEEECLTRIAGAVNDAHRAVPGVTVVLENTAGQGTNVGYRFEQLAFIIAKVVDKSRIGVCLDTCHAFAAGYDLRSRATFDATLHEFDATIGLNYLKGAHVNDAKIGFGSRLDRHQNIGKGTIGLDAFKFIMRDERFDGIPLVLETIDETLWKEEVAMLKGFET
jgi:deoxyribonuclease IV